MEEEHISESGREVKVGQTLFRIRKVKNSMLTMVGRVEITDPITGESRTFTTPTPGWMAEAVAVESER